MSVADAAAPRFGSGATTGERGVTRTLHRLFFTALGVLPGPMSKRARATIFNRLFTSGAPWPYAECPYESAKRDHLIAQVPSGARMIVEIGCADGHNLLALAQSRPHSHVIGVDISDRACDLARERNKGQAHVEVVSCESAALVSMKPDLAGRVDALVISEVLYYLGAGQHFDAQLAPLTRLLASEGCVIAVHTCADATDLHRRAAVALDLRIAREQQVSLGNRSFTVSVLTANA